MDAGAIRGRLQGWKTYLTGVSTLIGIAVAWSGGEVGGTAALLSAGGVLTAIFLRAGLHNVGTLLQAVLDELQAVASKGGDKVGMLLLFLLLPIMAIGCNKTLDDDLMRVDEKAQQSWKAAKAVLDNGLVGYDQTETSRAKYEELEVDRRLNTWLDTHTGPDGRLYASTRPADMASSGTPLLRADVMLVVRQRDELLLAAKENARRNRANISAMREVIIRYDVMVDTITDEKASILEKRKSATAALDAAITAFTSAGGGAGLTALLMAL